MIADLILFFVAVIAGSLVFIVVDTFFYDKDDKTIVRKDPIIKDCGWTREIKSMRRKSFK